MPSHRERRVLPYSSKQMFDLVMDIEKYPEFLPWCISSRVHTRTEELVDADVTVGYQMLREKFRSKVYTNRPDKITIDYTTGPLKNLENKWVFKDLENGKCQIDFYVSFEMKSFILSGIANKLFDKVFKRMMYAFENRAEKVYG